MQPESLLPPPPTQPPFVVGRSSAHVTAGIWLVFGNNQVGFSLCLELSFIRKHKPPLRDERFPLSSWRTLGKRRRAQGTSLVVQWLRLHSQCIQHGFDAWSGNWTPLRVWMPQVKILPAATKITQDAIKTHCSQIEIFFFFLKRGKLGWARHL